MVTDSIRWRHGGLTPEGQWSDAARLDLSVNINPYGPDPDLTQTLRLQPFDQYPDPQQTALRHGLAQMRGCSPDEILVGNGCNELFWAAARAFLGSHSRWISVEPNYSEFARAAAACGSTQIDCIARAEDDFRWSADTLQEHIWQHQPTLVLLSNPCSPTGFMQDIGSLQGLAENHKGVMFCIDQSFLSLCRHWQAGFGAKWPKNVLLFQSLTKDFAIAGLRLGYVEGQSHHLQAMQKQIPTWSVNSLAQAAGLWITHNAAKLHASRDQIFADHERMEDGLRQRGIRFVPSQTIYTMLRPPDAQTLQIKLWQAHRVLVRSCATYGLPDWLRISARPSPPMECFWQALDEELTWNA